MTTGPLRLLDKGRKALAPCGAVDAVAGGRVTGWASGRGALRVEAWLDGTRVASCVPSIPRPDVKVAYPDHLDAGTSGFALDLPQAMRGADFIGELRIVARPVRPWRPSATLASVRVAGTAISERMADAPDSGVRGPFPRRVVDAIAACWPEDCADLTSIEGQRRFVARLLLVMTTPELNALPALADYARYLSVSLAHCRFVERHFPPTNRNADPGSNDFHCKPNSVREIFSIVHQLYVLKSWGVEGDFAEFGCFKGYSSAMLSFACRQLGLKMHIFDSFEGLPRTEGSGYAAGQYAGSLEEVGDHVSRFGAIDVVTFHKGFFADTFRDWRPPRLMCLWMDVDLESSARDLMIVADRLSPQASLFSHECAADIFDDGAIVTHPRPDNPIPPMLARHDELRRPLTGRYIAGYTGGFWPRDDGIPIVDNGLLMEIGGVMTQ
ncbi:class I SAM-dependent methyltransferase [Sphingomonas bacterium]|uniref:class I SAM-dependent methyltransferase n=1 Tax=Sphingomonas bacterium TaxID=1895847 RepID=UPI0015762E56|nr:class I SAM-dependent methyltransferase [Sphingomonas bacterium]